MKSPDEALSHPFNTLAPHQHGHSTALVSDLLPLCDVVCLSLVAAIGHPVQAVLAGTVLAPFILYDKDFGAVIGQGRRLPALLGAHVLRFAVLAGVVLLLDMLGIALIDWPSAGLLGWLAAGLLLTLLTRVLVAAYVRRWARRRLLPAAHLDLVLPNHPVAYVGPGVPVSLLADRPISRWNILLKQSEDYFLGAIITLLLLPLLLVITLAVMFSGPGPVFFRQRRHAMNSHEFDIYKFRTMHWNPQAAGEPLQQTSRNDGRITRIGRFLRATSLDELPQLFNVLKGEMSLVGPRPHAIDMRTQNRLGHEITSQYAHRHRVKPGMTGWAQVNGARGATDTTEQLQRRVMLDLQYIDEWSLWLDLKILVLTFREVVRGGNAY